VALNLVICAILSYQLIQSEGDIRVLHLTSLALFLVSSVLYALSVCLKPGYLRVAYDFKLLVQDFIDDERDLGNLCTYCDLIKSQTSFHCLYCRQCVELFDHHCPYINNCLGFKNHKYFLALLIVYLTFIVTTLVFIWSVNPTLAWDNLVITAAMCIFLPVTLYQCYSQLRILSSQRLILDAALNRGCCRNFCANLKTVFTHREQHQSQLRRLIFEQ
jgi:hypothetical protein